VGIAPGVGVVATLPFFRLTTPPAMVSESYRWPEFDARAYALGVAVELCSGAENPLTELATRIEEIEQWRAADATAQNARNIRFRSWQETGAAWRHCSVLTRVFARAMARQAQGPMRDLLSALMTAASDEQLATGDDPPALDEQVLSLIRDLGREVINADSRSRQLGAA
jgi:hypothetical protein